jgi:hypothetical protein
MSGLPFRQVWAVDFEFIAGPGERPVPVCMVARELRSGALIRLWQDELSRPAPPFPTDNSALFVAYFASAELGCFRVLGWPTPARILDLYAEYRAQTNGLPTPCGRGLLGALKTHGIEAMPKAEKGAMRELVLAGRPYSAEDRSAILDYCQEDVDALARLLLAMLPQLDLPRALLRGRYMAAVAAMEHVGTPIDVPTFTRLREGWGAIRGELVRRIDANYGVFEGVTFKVDRFADYLARIGIPWPRLWADQVQGAPGAGGSAAASENPGRTAPERPCRWPRRSKPLSSVALRGQVRTKHSQQLQVRLRTLGLAPGPDQTATRAWARIRRLVVPGSGDRRGALW